MAVIKHARGAGDLREKVTTKFGAGTSVSQVNLCRHNAEVGYSKFQRPKKTGFVSSETEPLRHAEQLRDCGHHWEIKFTADF